MLKAYRKTNYLPFAEMVIALLFFIVSFAVIIRVFATADGMERAESRRERASLCAQSVAEAYSVSGDADSALKLVLGGSAGMSGDEANIGLDDAMCLSEQPTITLALREESEEYPAGTYSELIMSFSADGEEFYSLTCGAYVEQGGAEDE